MNNYIGDYPPTFNAPQGWICPKCGRVYSPITSMCWYCGNEVVTNTYTTDTPHHLPDIIITSTNIPINYNGISPFLKNLINELGD